ncbi:hypothetical protein H696_02606 [Fonticula alba]|uniref:serine C-palmitoyltransferase n=1 Tax=Fonticula alba TaxID=691883 RepID=A0A058Z831_FONAL|nr:hypothetical protein H696_02606 [Fonticula alba]KCV70276.1 hypothetical protein H696_02606 [Fonticula alba]|eukprot:XP_009494792.1 hypothetical protein H696_02606 [Fonticula alba]
MTTTSDLNPETVALLERGLRLAMRAVESVPGAPAVVNYLSHSYHNDRWRLFLEILLVGILTKYLLSKKYRPREAPAVVLTDREIDQLVAEWEPEPLPMPLTKADNLILDSHIVFNGPSGKYLAVDSKRCLNFASLNFLGMTDRIEIRHEAEKVLRDYGVGTCGPPGFYGTLDAHLELETSIANFVGKEMAILYSYGFAAIASCIPAYAKKGDIIVVDEAASFAVQRGVYVSRADVHTFKHNDMADLEAVLQKIEKTRIARKQPLTRRFIVVEGLYQNTGTICDLVTVTRLKTQYKYRLVVEDSFGFGTLGKTGRGAVEHTGADMGKVDFYVASLANSLAGAGGFVAGATDVIDHQRLAGLGYTFSASMPAIMARASLRALKILRDEPEALIGRLRANTAHFRQALTHQLKAAGLQDTVELPGVVESPAVHVRLVHGSPLLAKLGDDRFDEECLLEAVVTRARVGADVVDPAEAEAAEAAFAKETAVGQMWPSLAGTTQEDLTLPADAEKAAALASATLLNGLPHGGVVFTRAKYALDQELPVPPPASIRVVISAAHGQAELDRAAAVLAKSLKLVISERFA